MKTNVFAVGMLLSQVVALQPGLATIHQPSRQLQRQKIFSSQPRIPRGVSSLSATLSVQSTCQELQKASPVHFLQVLWDFTRPHTLIGSAVSLVSLFLFATPQALWFTKQFLVSLFSAIVPSLLMNLYITGLNQITDVDIDKINKPYLPIAAGQMSLTRGIVVVVVSLIASLLMVRQANWPLQAVVVGSGILGTLYSVPPFRLKRFPLLAAFCILVVRGSLVNMGFFFQAKAAMLATQSKQLPSSLISACQMYPESVLLTSFFAVFGVVIALMKDVPDVEGDELNKIKSFSVRLGAPAMFDIARNLLISLLSLSAIGALATAAAAATSPVVMPAVIACRTTLGMILGTLAVDVKQRAVTVDTKQPKEIFKYYMHIWNVFYGCYLLLPLVR